MNPRSEETNPYLPTYTRYILVACIGAGPVHPIDYRVKSPLHYSRPHFSMTKVTCFSEKRNRVYLLACEPTYLRPE